MKIRDVEHSLHTVFWLSSFRIHSWTQLFKCQPNWDK